MNNKRTRRMTSKRIARKRALRMKHGIENHLATRDAMRAARRGYGLGIGK